MTRLMKGVGQLLDYTMNSLDVSSGANDVIVIQHSDGTLHCTDFNVRFGKLKVVRSREKIVRVEINGKPTEAYMKIGEAGEAYWLIPTTRKVPSELMSSPLHSPKMSPSLSPSTTSLDGEHDLPPLSMSPPNPVLGPMTPPSSHQDPIMSPTSIDEKIAKANPALSEFHQHLVAAAKESPAPGVDGVEGGAQSEDSGAALTGSLRLSSESIPIINTPLVIPNASGVVTESLPPSTQPGEEEEYEEGEEEGEEGEGDATKHWMISVQPTQEHLIKLNLVPGKNTVTFITHSSLRGKQEIHAKIYFWTPDVKIVVSDVDGTVTRSDVLGHILPRLGKDWTHDGICDFYTRIAQNGYKVLYLTARSIGQMDTTRQFLTDVVQGGVRLPEGPVLGAPDRIFTALRREVITKTPYEFKIVCLKSVLKTFPPGVQPYYAGFGNRVGDVISYNAVGIPNHKILIIDAKSQVHICQVKSTYKNLSEVVNEGFPPVGSLADAGRRVSADYNQMHYWTLDVQNYFSPTLDTTTSGIKEKYEYVIRHTKTEKLLSASGADNRCYLELSAVPDDKSMSFKPNLVWTFEPKIVPEGTVARTFYVVKNKHSKKGMNIRSGSLDANARVWQFDNFDSTHTQFQLILVNRTLSTFRIVNRNSKRCLAVDAATGNVVQTTTEGRNNDPNVTWQLVELGPVELPPA